MTLHPALLPVRLGIVHSRHHPGGYLSLDGSKMTIIFEICKSMT